MELTDSQIKDLMLGTLNELGRGRFTQIAQELQEYEVMSNLLKKEKVIFDSGKGIQRTIMTKVGGTFRHVGLHSQDEVNISDLLDKINITWKHGTAYWAWERREMLENRGKALIVNIIKPRRAAAMIDIAQGMEEAFFAAPDPSDKLVPYGIKYWIVKNSTLGFNGGNPTGFGNCAGIDSDEVPAWKNYTGEYTDISKLDLVKKLRKAHRKTNWKSPVTIQDFRGPMGQKRRLYVNEETLSDIEDLGEAQNENLGRDIASMDDQIVFKKHPIVWVPYLDDDSTNPVYMIDRSTFYPVILKGDYMRETEPEKAPKQHNTFVIYVDITYNYLCIDRRRNAVFSLAAA